MPSLRVAVTAAVVTLTLCGCATAGPPSKLTGPPAPAHEPITLEPVGLPQEWLAPSGGSDTWSVLPAATGLPRTAVTTTGGAPEVWSADGDATFTRSATLDTGGVTLTAAAASDGTTTAVAGQTYRDGLPRGYLFVSDDRRAWQRVDLGAAAAPATHLAVADGTVLLAGAGSDGRSPAVVVHDRAGTSVTDLPEPAAQETTRVVALAAAGQRAVVVTRTGPPGDPGPPTAYVTTDGSFAPHPLGEASDEISGMVATEDGFVATGSREQGGYRRPAAWTSTDGAAWHADDARMPSWETDPTGGTRTAVDHWFGPPVHDRETGRVTAAIMQHGAAHVFAVERRADGGWEAPLRSGPLGHSAQGVAYRAGDQLRVLATHTGGSATEAAAGAATVLVDHDGGYALDQHVDLGGTLGLVGARRAFEVADDGEQWRSGRRTTQAVLGPGGDVTVRDWLPEQLPAGAEPVVARDPGTGTQVALAVLPGPDGTFPAAGWVRANGGQWAPVTGIEPGVYQYPTVVAATADGWFAAAQTAGSPSLSQTQRVAEIWGSPDGHQWHRQQGEFALDGGQDSVVVDICAGPTGPVAVGWARDAGGRSRAVAWQRAQPGDWVPAVLESAGPAWFESCFVADDGELRVTGQAGTSRVWGLPGLDVVAELAPGLRRGAVRTVDGGFAAGGFEQSAEHYGPLLWLSADGQEWEPVRVPVRAPGSPGDVEVAPVAGDLLVTTPGEAFLLPDVATHLTP